VERQPAQLAPQGGEAGAAMEERAWGSNSAKVASLKHHGQENVLGTWAIANMIIHGLGGVVETAATFKNPRYRNWQGRLHHTDTSSPIHCGAIMVYISQPEIKCRSPLEPLKTGRPTFLNLTN
jgi:hypothetical protein